MSPSATITFLRPYHSAEQIIHIPTMPSDQHDYLGTEHTRYRPIPTEPTEALYTYILASVAVTRCTLLPTAAYQPRQPTKPGPHEHEKSIFYYLLISFFSLSITGPALAYFPTSPAARKSPPSPETYSIQPHLEAKTYTHICLALRRLFSRNLVFQLPVMASITQAHHSRRIIYPITAMSGIFIPDMVSQVLTLIVMITPYEPPVSIAKFVRRTVVASKGTVTEYERGVN